MSKYSFTVPETYTPPNVRGNLDKLLRSGECAFEAKLDGARQLLGKTIDGRVFMTGRRTSSVTGNKLDKIGHAPHLKALAESLPPGTVLDGEAMITGGTSRDVTRVLGSAEDVAISKQEENPRLRLHYVTFDVITIEGRSLVDDTKATRNLLLNDLFKDLGFFNGVQNKTPVISKVKTYTVQNVEVALRQALSDGYEGLVVKPLDGNYTHLQSAKIKPMKTFDMIIMGYDDSDSDTFFGNGIAALQLGLKDSEGNWRVTCHCSGMTHDERRMFYENKEAYIGMVVEIKGQEMYRETGAVRHPVFVKLRNDVDANEQTFSKYGLEG